ncbi:Bug family tripartite tricarboxylate transporter substrate binding protein [Aureimonas frigidaquae]|uniref:Tricarboxylic transport n=1 Tax=Aureimonas frigidaquae TaxID=424757 RepID=A0A0P0Z3J0_9HYPH|nr:tripartite tricarboxylate transporter substrate-binding protein [Aureimonas frigidaquae]BAT28679.1 tricarboxylic transport [Aureimonas frigidaquae]
MTTINRRRFAVLAAAAAALALVPGAPAFAQDLKPIDGLRIMAPSSPGSGYDQLARTMQAALQEDKLATSVEVENAPGGGGTVGLAQYVTARPRHPNALIIGFALVGGVLTTKSQVTLDQVEPVARLMGEAEAIVVPANSDIKTMADLVAKLKENPGAVSWAGGSIGGVDHVMVGLIAKTVGVDPTKVNYVVHAGGGEVLASTLGGHATVGVSGYEEFRSQVEAGQLRALAVSGDTRMEGVDVPTLKEAGVDLAIVNWRGVMVHPRTPAKDKEALKAAIDAMVKTPAWQEALKRRGWLDTYLPADAFQAFLAEEQERIGGALREAGIVQ